MFDPNDISLDSITKMFEFERQARLIDDIDDIEQLRTMLKASAESFPVD